MFAKNSKAYSVYLLFRFVFSLAVSMSTVLSIVYHLEVVQRDAFQLVLVGTVLEPSCFLFEIPTGVVADLYSRRHQLYRRDRVSTRRRNVRPLHQHGRQHVAHS